MRSAAFAFLTLLAFPLVGRANGKFFWRETIPPAYLHRFREKLTPGQMRDDLRFQAAEDPKPFRERIVRW